jgi:hypothetical protein
MLKAMTPDNSELSTSAALMGRLGLAGRRRSRATNISSAIRDSPCFCRVFNRITKTTRTEVLQQSARNDSGN